MRFRVELSGAALADLEDIYDGIAERSGSRRIALGFVRRLRRQCAELNVFPERGMLRPELGEGVRVIGFERRLAIVFRVRGAEVEIMRLLYGGRDLSRAVRPSRGEPGA